MRVGLFQRVVPEYRTGIFSLLARQPGIRLTVYATAFHGDLPGADCRRTAEIRIGPLRLHPAPLLAALRGRQDVMICEGGVSLVASVLLAVFGRYRRVRCVWWTSMYRPDDAGGLRRRVSDRLAGVAIRRADAVLAYGSLAAEAARRAGAAPGRVFVAFNSLDTERLRRIERGWRDAPGRLEAFLRDRGLAGRRVILYAGRLVPSKRVDWVLELMKRLDQDGSDPSLCAVILGDGSERDRLVEQVRRDRLQSRVIFTGAIRDDEASCPYFLAAKVLALPGTGGLAINHAMTFGVPVVAAGGDGTERDAIDDGVNGHLVAPSDKDRFTEALRRVVLADDRRWAALSAGARATVDRRVNSAAMVRAMIEAARPHERAAE